MTRARRFIREWKANDPARHQQAGQWIRFFRRRFTLLPDRDDLSDRWLGLVERHSITGFRAHDARLVAAIQSYGVTQILTFNGGHFRGLPVTVLEPALV